VRGCIGSANSLGAPDMFRQLENAWRAAKAAQRSCERDRRKPMHWLPPLVCRGFPSDTFWPRHLFP
jgi:hypothetical protein